MSVIAIFANYPKAEAIWGYTLRSRAGLPVRNMAIWQYTLILIPDGLPDGCRTVHPDNFLHFQLKQDSLESQAGRHR
jgi:hypothetical protein